MAHKQTITVKAQYTGREYAGCTQSRTASEPSPKPRNRSRKKTVALITSSCLVNNEQKSCNVIFKHVTNFSLISYSYDIKKTPNIFMKTTFIPKPALQTSTSSPQLFLKRPESIICVCLRFFSCAGTARDRLLAPWGHYVSWRALRSALAQYYLKDSNRKERTLTTALIKVIRSTVWSDLLRAFKKKNLTGGSCGWFESTSWPSACVSLFPQTSQVQGKRESRTRRS